MSTKNIFKGICTDYIQMNDAYKTYFPLHYRKKEDLIQRKTTIDELMYSTEAVAALLHDYNRTLGATEQTLTNISKLKAGAYAVVTGQQAGIFTGPLYTLYKAITTIKLAQQWERELGTPVVPIFWIASEDHDFHEIHAVNYMDSNHVKSVKIHQTFKGSEGLIHQKSVFLKKSIGDLIVNHSYLEALKALKDSDDTQADLFESLEVILKDAIEKEQSLGSCFGKMMMHLFGQYGLVFVDPMLPALRTLESDFFVKALENREGIVAALNAQTAVVKSNGFEPALQIEPASSQLFVYTQGERLLLKKLDDSWCVEGEHTETYTSEALVKLAKEQPEKFSTNVVLRPVVQDVIFKTLAYVAGPGEMSYYAQLKGVYQIFGLEMPIIYPRENFTIIPKELNQSIEQFGLQGERVLFEGIEVVKKNLLKEKDAIDIEGLFDQLEKSIETDYKKTLEAVASLSPHLEALQEKNLGLILRQVAYIKDKSQRFHRKNHPEIMSLVNDIECLLMPNGALQERFYSLYALKNIRPTQLIEELMSIETIQDQHQIVVL